MRTTLLALALLATTGTTALAVSGSASLTGHSTLAPKHCRHDRGSFTATVQLLADGTWTAQGDLALSGTITAVGRSGRKFLLDFDDPSRMSFLAALADEASTLCQLPVTVTGASRKAFTLVFNRKGTRATLTIRYRLTGTAAGHPGHASYQLGAKGTWTPG
jgi:hypothetical protein